MHRCPHVLEYPHRLLSFSNILPIEFYGMKSDGILIVLKQPVRNIENTRKYALKWNRYLIPIFIVSFDLYEHVLATSLEKWKTNFPRLFSWSSLCCHYGISNILLHHQNLLPRNPEISVRWFLLKPVLKQMRAQGWQGKRRQMGTILLRYQPSVTCKPRTVLNGSGNDEQCVIMSYIFPNCYRNDTYKFWNVFTVNSYAV